MKNFIIQFDEKVGSTAMVQILDNFKGISIIHQDGLGGWEPFDCHCCGEISLRRLRKCFELIYSNNPSSQELLNYMYNKSATGRLVEFETAAPVGFKMRFGTKRRMATVLKVFRNVPVNSIKNMVIKIERKLKNRMLYKFLKEYNIIVFTVVRQDVFRWALSKYHGGDGINKNHLQFALAKGEVSKESLGKIHIEPERFSSILDNCIEKNCDKFLELQRLKRYGIKAYPILYEEFLENKHAFFKRICKILNVDADDKAIEKSIGKGTALKKVHSNDISEFIENHEEILERFGNRFTPWWD